MVRLNAILIESYFSQKSSNGRPRQDLRRYNAFAESMESEKRNFDKGWQMKRSPP